MKWAVRFERRIFALALLAGLPGTGLALFLLWTGSFTPRTRWTLALLVVLAWLAIALVLRERVIRPLQTLANLLGALREEDFSLRARGARPDDALGLALLEANALGSTLQEQRLGALEATGLLRTVMGEIPVAVFAFDAENRLRLVNRAGERLVGIPARRLLRRHANEIGLGGCLLGDAPRIIDHAFPGGAGRWEVRRGAFRQGGAPHQLLVIADLSRALREEERQAWQRLVRVLSHEINNSLAPIYSLAGTLSGLLDQRAPDWEEDLREGLAVIGGRSNSLARFIAAYTSLARLPPPEPGPVNVAAWVNRVAGLEQRLPVQVIPGPGLTIRADGDQLDQLLINLLRNAVDASLETGGAVRTGWTARDGRVQVWVEDEGPGLPETANLFVPFFTTKPQGSGIGLALSRQIAEAHGGALSLENRLDHQGCTARLELPVG